MSTSATKRNPRSILLGVGVALIAGAFLFAALFMGEDVPTMAEVAGAPTVEGGLPPLPETGDPSVGEPAPTATGADFNGNPVTVGEPGTPQMIVFMASWCPACRAELPEVVEWLDDGGLPEGVEFVAVSTSLDDSRPNWPPHRWFEREEYKGPLLVDDEEQSVARAFGMSATPFWVFVDGSGNIVSRAAGQIPMDQVQQVANQLAATAG